jgi:hypothetical protein
LVEGLLRVLRRAAVAGVRAVVAGTVVGAEARVEIDGAVDIDAESGPEAGYGVVVVDTEQKVEENDAGYIFGGSGVDFD